MLKVGSRTPPPELLLNKRYQIVKVLSGIGWGKTYVAIDTHRADRAKCVVRCLKPISNDPDCLQAAQRLFNREAKILKILADCDRVPRLLNYRKVEHTFYLVQEYIEGQPLSDLLIPGKPWKESRVIKLLYEVLDILAVVHDRGIIHSDLRPDKLIRRSKEDRLVLTGFNVLNQSRSQLAAIQERIGATVALGTLGYMAIEQVRGKPQPSSDIYSLGTIAIQALTGLNPVQLEEDRRTGELIWQPQAKVSSALGEMISRMVRYHAGERYSSAYEVLDALDRLGIQDQKPGAIAETTETENGSSSALVVASSSTPEKEECYFTGLKASGIVTFIALAVSAGGFFFLRSPSLLRWFEGLLDPGDDLLAQAERKYQSGDINEAETLAKSIAPDSIAYDEAKTSLAQWRKDWELAQTQFKAVEEAFKQSQWQTVVEQANRTPKIAFWQQKMTTMVTQAQAKLDLQADEVLNRAYQQAIAKEFTQAIDTLKQIPEGTQAAAIVPEKVAEYEEKQQIRANYLLQQAYDRAAKRNFTEALAFLQKIPANTPAHKIAQAKVAEYKQKRNIKANYLLQRAYNRASVQDFAGALAHLQQIPKDTPAYEKARGKIIEYANKQNLKPNSQASSGSTQTSQPVARVPWPANFNPGNNLQEINAL